MNKIKVEVLNPQAIKEAEQMMVTAARLTQKGHAIKTMGDFKTLLNKTYSEKTIHNMTSLPHPTIQKFGLINVAVVGASRRFLAQITRHQNEVKFMSASLQYSDYSDDADFCVPYDCLDNYCARDQYLNACQYSMRGYKKMIEEHGAKGDSAGYSAPQGLRIAMIISATPYQWIHMISQRSCRRNTDETRYIMLRVWEQLWKLSPEWFSTKNCGPFCMKGRCQEGMMACDNPMDDFFDEHVSDPVGWLIKESYPLCLEVGEK